LKSLAQREKSLIIINQELSESGVGMKELTIGDFIFKSYAVAIAFLFVAATLSSF